MGFIDTLTNYWPEFARAVAIMIGAAIFAWLIPAAMKDKNTSRDHSGGNIGGYQHLPDVIEDLDQIAIGNRSSPSVCYIDPDSMPIAIAFQ